ncbi:MAG: DUF4339 domain-containing protein [Verrucomicrobiae bacterium]|nr:DUF4339 domain-containing protein [Verrucomicrobiae bacterium]
MMIFVNREGQQFGPYTKEDCLSYLADGQLFNHDLAWHEGLSTWQPLHALLGTKVCQSSTATSGEKRALTFEYADKKSTVQVDIHRTAARSPSDSGIARLTA